VCVRCVDATSSRVTVSVHVPQPPREWNRSCGGNMWVETEPHVRRVCAVPHGSFVVWAVYMSELTAPLISTKAECSTESQRVRVTLRIASDCESP